MQNIKSQPALDNDCVLISDFFVRNSSSQTYAAKEALKIIDENEWTDLIPEIVDLGCGAGNSFDEFNASGRKFNWIGLDIESSPEVNNRKRTDIIFKVYDGIHLPFADNSIDLIYSHQVFEHVHYPDELLKEVYRVLKPGRYFVGSTSHLEPFHSRSLWNFTPYGFILLLKRAGFVDITIKPGIDCLTMFLRRLLGSFRVGELLNPFFKIESPLNIIIELVSRILRIHKIKRNALKLLYSGHFVFIAKK